MKTPSKTNSAVVNHEFWLWEYQRRNNSYQQNLTKLISKAFANQDKLHPYKFEEQQSLPIFSETYIIQNYESNYIVQLPSFTHSAFIYQSGLDSVLSFISENKRFPKPVSQGYTGEKLVEDFVVSQKPLSFPVQDFHIPSIVSKLTKNSKNDSYILEWKSSKNHEIIQLELNWHLRLEEELLSKGQDDTFPPKTEKSSEALNAIRLWWAKRHFRERLTIATKPRAVGLWLWDYQQTHGLPGAKAINAFQENWVEGEHNKPIPHQFHHDDKLRKLLKTTDSCIKSIAVLPIA